MIEQAFVKRLKRSIHFRITNFFRLTTQKEIPLTIKLHRILMQILYGTPLYFPLAWPIQFKQVESSGRFNEWCEHREKEVEKKYRIKHRGRIPLFSILVPVCDPEPEWLRTCIDSVLSQTFSGWELILSDDASNDPEIARILNLYQKMDFRIHIEKTKNRGGISAATNRAARKAASKYLLFLDHDDALDSHCLAAFAEKIQNSSINDIAVLYADEDRFNDDFFRMHPGFKPDYSPDKLLAVNYIHHPVVISNSLFQSLGGLKSKFDGSQDHDLLLRASEKNQTFLHVPDILYHMRIHPGSLSSGPGAKPLAHVRDRKVINEALLRRNIAGSIQDTDCRSPGFSRIIRHMDSLPSVSIIIPGKRDTEPDHLKSIWKECQVLSAAGDTSVAMLNKLAMEAKGEILVFADENLYPVSDWQKHLLAHLKRKQIGLVTGKLVYPDNMLHSCGLAGGIAGAFGRWHHHCYAGDAGYGGWMNLDHEVWSVPRQFMAIDKTQFLQSGMFNEGFVEKGYEIDLCLRLHSTKRCRHLAIPGCKLMFNENYPVEPFEKWYWEDFCLLWKLWGDRILEGDPYINANISLQDEGIRFMDSEEEDWYRELDSVKDRESIPELFRQRYPDCFLQERRIFHVPER